jgi:hypothetical protein
MHIRLSHAAYCCKLPSFAGVSACIDSKAKPCKGWHGLIKSEDWRNVAPCTANQYPITNQPTPKPRTADQSMLKMG